MSVPDIPALLRPATPEDHPFIFRTWLETYRTDSVLCRPRYQQREWMDRKLYFAWQHAMVERLLGCCKLTVACPPEDPKTILGWSVIGMAHSLPKGGEIVPVLHYCFVRESFRLAGLGRRLCAEVVTAPKWYVTHRTFTSEPVLDRLAGWKWVPWAV